MGLSERITISEREYFRYKGQASRGMFFVNERTFFVNKHTVSVNERTFSVKSQKCLRGLIY